MDKLFLDANILFTATYSNTGASWAIFELAKKKKLKIVSSLYAVTEAQKNIITKAGEGFLVTFFKLVSILSTVDKSMPSAAEVLKFSEFIIAKDVPILASSFEQKVNFLITLDQKDFRNEKIKNLKLPFVILSPGEYLRGV